MARSRGQSRRSNRQRLTARATLLLAAVAAATLPPPVAAKQQPLQVEPPEVKIVSPRRDAQPTDGPLVIQALVRPGDRTLARVDAYLDGSHLGSLSQPPFRWRARGKGSSETSMIRIIASDERGGRGADELLLTPRIVAGFHAEAPAVTLNLSVLDRGGRFVSDLRPAEITVRDDGYDQNLLDFTRTDAPLKVVMLLDRSYSMTEKMAQTRRAVQAFCRQLEAADQVKLIAFNHNIISATPFTTEHEEIAEMVGKISADGGTALYDALLISLDDLKAQPETKVRRAILVFTDGHDQHSANSMQRVVEEALSAGITVYAIGQGDALGSRPLRRVLSRIARSTGGEAYFEPDPDALPAIFERIGHAMRTLYFVSFEPSNPQPGWHQLEVEIGREAIEVRHKTGYVKSDPLAAEDRRN